MDNDKVELPSGEWARLRDPAKITEAGRRVFKLAVAKSKMGMPEGLVESDDAAIAMFVVDWSYTRPDGSPRAIPQAEMAGLQELSPADYDALLSSCSPLIKEVFNDNFGMPDPANPEADPEQTSPFGGSSGSAGS